MTGKVEDRSIEFILSDVNGGHPPPLESLADVPFKHQHWRDAFDDLQEDLRKEVWGLKTRLDAIESNTYLATRNFLFPLASSGAAVSHAFFNRAGYKLLESMEATGVWIYLRSLPRFTWQDGKGKRKRIRSQPLCFVDVCGGPGAFSQALLAVGRRKGFPKLEGFGMTLGNVDGFDWYKELRRASFTSTYGLDGTGDIYKLANIEALASLSTQVLLCVADGGFDVDFSIANYQETISARILLGQWLAGLKILQRGGCLILKLFDTFAPFTRSVLFLSTFLYEHVHVVKPKHSRVVNSERYLVCINYIGMEYCRSGWLSYFERFYSAGFEKENYIPELIPADWMMTDQNFIEKVMEMNQTIGRNQIAALQMILDASLEVEARLKVDTKLSDITNP